MHVANGSPAALRWACGHQGTLKWGPLDQQITRYPQSSYHLFHFASPSCLRICRVRCSFRFVANPASSNNAHTSSSGTRRSGAQSISRTTDRALEWFDVRVLERMRHKVLPLRSGIPTAWCWAHEWSISSVSPHVACQVRFSWPLVRAAWHLQVRAGINLHHLAQSFNICIKLKGVESTAAGVPRMEP